MGLSFLLVKLYLAKLEAWGTEIIMKLFINQKIGYTSGVYGCSGEQFQLIIINNNEIVNCFVYDGLYGHEHRISEAIKAKGYKEIYAGVGRIYGKLKREDAKYAKSETEALAEIEKL